MKTRTAIVGALLLAVLLVGAWFAAQSKGVMDRSTATRSEQDERAGATAADGAARAASARVNPSATEAQALTPEEREVEEEVLTMYDEMLTAISANPGDCDRAGAAVEVVLATHGAAVAKLRAQRDGWAPARFVAAQKRMEAQEGERLERFRHGVKQAVMRCRVNGRLIRALESMANLSAQG